MKSILTVAILLGAVASAPAWAGEGAGYPVDGSTPGVTTQMTMTSGGISDPFKWSAATTKSQYSMTSGGISDPYKWSATPVPPAANKQATSAPAAHNPG